MIMFNQPILFVSENSDNYTALKTGLGSTNFSNPVFRCKGIDDALSCLFHRGGYAFPVRSPRPGIILIDFDLAETDICGFVRELKQDKELSKIPTLLVSSQDRLPDVSIRLKRYSDGCLERPVSPMRLLASILKLGAHSFEVVILPNAKPPPGP